MPCERNERPCSGEEGDHAMRTCLIMLAAAMLQVFMGSLPAEAARQFTVSQTSPAPPGLFDMSSTQSVTFRVANTSNGTNASETVRIVRFRVSGTYTTFSNTTAAPAGWTRTSFSATSITFTANTTGDRIPSTGTNYEDFMIVLIMGASTIDRSDLLSSVRATFSTGSRVTLNNQGSWTLKSLTLTSFLITDCAGNSISAVDAGNTFCLVMSVRNLSTATQNGIASNTNPPAPNVTGTVTPTLVSTTYAPTPLNLAAGAAGSITFRYSTNVNDSGTISFTAYAWNGATTVTSRQVTSPVLNVSRFVASITVSPNCQYNGQTMTVTMRLTNGFAYNIINVAPALAPSAGAPVVYVSGPSPAAPAGPVPANGGTFDFTWVYRMSGGAPGQAFTFNGSAAGTGQTGGNPARTTPLSASAPPSTRGGFDPVLNPVSTNAGSTLEELTWTIINQGCGEVNQVSVTMPAGWPWNNDAYSLVQESAGNYVETWSVSSAGSNPIVFTAPTALDRYPVGLDGKFSVVFTGTPAASGVNSISIIVTDENGQSETNIRQITVNPYDNATPGQGNYTGTGSWGEVIK